MKTIFLSALSRSLIDLKKVHMINAKANISVISGLMIYLKAGIVFLILLVEGNLGSIAELKPILYIHQSCI